MGNLLPWRGVAQNQHKSTGNRYHYCLVAQVAFKESVWSHPEGMAIGICPQEHFWAVAQGGSKILDTVLVAAPPRQLCEARRPAFHPLGRCSWQRISYSVPPGRAGAALPVLPQSPWSVAVLTWPEVSIPTVRDSYHDVVSCPVSLILPGSFHSGLPWMCEVKSFYYLNIVNAIIVPLL